LRPSAQSRATRDAGPSAPTRKRASRPEAVAPAARDALAAFPRLAERDLDARVARARAQPAHQRGRVGREEEIAGESSATLRPPGACRRTPPIGRTISCGSGAIASIAATASLTTIPVVWSLLAGIALALAERDRRAGARGAIAHATPAKLAPTTSRSWRRRQSSGRNRSDSARWNCSGGRARAAGSTSGSRAARPRRRRARR
jgi:hypothetical protein